MVSFGFSQPIENIEKPSSKTLPDTALHLPAETLEHLDRQKFMRHLFPVKRMIPLEVTEESVLSGLQDLLYSGGVFYAIDQSLGPVYRFDQNGKFLGVLGAMGQGPGEYQGAVGVYEIFDQNIAVVDWQSSRIHVFAPDGSFLFATPKPPQRTGGVYLAGPALSWPKKNRLFLANFASGELETTLNWHAVVDVVYSKQEDCEFISELVPKGAFADRYQHVDGSGAFHNALASVGESLWVGSPYGSQIEIYDEDGRLMKSLKRTCRMTTTHAQFKEAEQNQDATLLARYTNMGCTSQWKIVHFGPLVLVNQAHGGIFFFDESGNPVGRPKGYLSGIGLLLTGFENGLATAMNPETLTKPAYENERDALSAIGFELEDLKHANPIIRVGFLPGLE